MQSMNSAPSEQTGQNSQPNSGRWNWLLRLIGWGAGCLLALIGLIVLITPGGFPEKIAALGLMLAGAVALPPISRLLAGRVPVLGGSIAPLIAAFIVVVATMIVGGVAATIQSSLDPAATAEREQRRNARQEQRAADERREQVEAHAAAQQAVADRQTAFDRFWSDLTKASRPCEEAQKNFAEQLQRRQFSVAAYDAASRGQQVCFSAHNAIRALEVPEEIEGEASEAIQKGIDACTEAALARMTFLDIAASVIDGDRRPSRLSAAQAQGQAAQTATLQCVVHITHGATKAGLKIPE